MQKREVLKNENDKKKSPGLSSLLPLWKGRELSPGPVLILNPLSKGLIIFKRLSYSDLACVLLEKYKYIIIC